MYQELTCTIFIKILLDITFICFFALLTAVNEVNNKNLQILKKAFQILALFKVSRTHKLTLHMEPNAKALAAFWDMMGRLCSNILISIPSNTACFFQFECTIAKQEIFLIFLTLLQMLNLAENERDLD